MPKVGATSEVVTIDNGYILVEPTGKTYLLVDAGVAQKKRSGSKKAEDIAKDILANKFPGVAFQGLLQPTAGDAGDNYAAGTIFAKGSIIALYDDTSDMSGKVDVTALTSGLQTVGLMAEWTAELVK